MKKIIAAALIVTVMLTSLISCGKKSAADGLDINEREIKNIVVEAIKEDMDSSYAIVTSMNYTLEDGALIVRAKVLLPEYCFYEIYLEQQDSNWTVTSCGKDI